MNEPSTSGENARVTLSLSFKMPVFWENRPNEWFDLLEFNFKTHKINCEWKKFCYTLMCLDLRILNSVQRMMDYRPHYQAYSILKRDVIDKFTNNRNGIRTNANIITQPQEGNEQMDVNEDSHMNGNREAGEMAVTVSQPPVESPMETDPPAQNPVEVIEDDPPAVVPQMPNENNPEPPTARTNNRQITQQRRVNPEINRRLQLEYERKLAEVQEMKEVFEVFFQKTRRNADRAMANGTFHLKLSRFIRAMKTIMQPDYDPSLMNIALGITTVKDDELELILKRHGLKRGVSEQVVPRTELGTPDPYLFNPTAEQLVPAPIIRPERWN